ncbi:ABC transporter permease [Bradyrhizobium sp. BR 1432]|uniref:ABC transporter permease n=1 Tax=Bradyrhizobium sp. BR 1432 TaxID=3447966 RepID=UPI003EE7B17E
MTVQSEAATVADIGGAAVKSERIEIATPRQLMWLRFRKHKLAVASAVVLLGFYLIALIAPFLATAEPNKSEAQRSLMPPVTVHWFDDGQFAPHVFKMVGKRDPKTFRRVYVEDPTQKFPLHLFGRGFEYKLFWLIPTDIHLLGLENAPIDENLFLLGTDVQGRDVFSRLLFATQVSMSIGLVGVSISLFLGIVLGGISGFFGGLVDTAIQRVIEILRSIPTIPLWMGLAAALPQGWSAVQIYFAISIIISIFGWTELARVVRGRFLALRQEDFVMAARLCGASLPRTIFRHMLPSFLSHIIAASTLAIPEMIIAETALSFLGLGLAPPAVSYGVMLQAAQNVQTIATTPWLMVPAIPITIAVLAFNFLGDGLRDAADPYSQ